jgi:N-acetyl-D-muramate 6-phosphate phosphatase
LSKELRGVLFDLDGTLLDTAPDLVASLNRVRAEQLLPPLPFALARTQVSHGSTGLIRLAFPAADAERFEELRKRLLTIYSTRIADETRLFAGGDVLLDSLEKQGLRWGIVTNKPGFLTTPLLAALGLTQRVGCVVSGDTLAERKPHPAPLLHAAKQLDLPPSQCLYVGDAERDVQAARAAGMPVLLASYGYLGPDDEPQRWGADGAIDSLPALLPWLEARAS